MYRFRVLIVNDHEVIRQLLTVLVNDEENMQVVGEATDRIAAVEIARKLIPDVILMDRNMTKRNDGRATQEIHSEFSQMNVIGLSLSDRPEIGQAMLDTGAISCLSKDPPWNALLSGILEAVKLNFSLIKQYKYSYNNQVKVIFNALL